MRVLVMILPPRQGVSPTILVVDDEPKILAMMALTLKKFGGSVLTARNGREALELYWENSAQIRLVLLDLKMPGMSGTFTPEALRSSTTGCVAASQPATATT